MKYLFKTKVKNQLMSKDNSPDNNYRILRADCENCFGLCCVALYFSVTEGFPIDKEAGQPCINLQENFSCSVHKNLIEQGLKGCVAFDCFGSGQKVAQVSFSGHNWRKVPESAEQMFDVFLVMRQLHQLLWYLTEALMLEEASSIHGEISSMLYKIEGLTYLSPNSLMELDVEKHHSNVDNLLSKTSQLVRVRTCKAENNISVHKKRLGGRLDFIGADLRKGNLKGQNFRGAYLIASNLRGADLSGADFLGADLRDADLRGANLSKSIFLTQAQINATMGDHSTKLPLSLIRPIHWEIK